MPVIYTTGDGNTYSAGDGAILALLDSKYVTDRTAKDVARWKELRDKGWENMTAEERIEWLAPMKGCYGFTDMNRVESAVEALSARLSELGYLFHPTVKTNWARYSIPTKQEVERYYGNVAKLRELLAVYPDTPEAPTIGDRLDWNRANDIEKILSDVEKLADIVAQNRYYVGDIFAGEV